MLHSHLPWLAHHGRWPVGEEWLYQSWAHSYLPVLDVVTRLAAQGRRELLTLGVTPVLAAQLDDPHCLRGVHDWLGGWLLRAAPWTEAEHTVSAINADTELASRLGVEPGAACLVLERRTFQGQDVVTYARLTHPGSRHSMTERFSPQG